MDWIFVSSLHFFCQRYRIHRIRVHGVICCFGVTGVLVLKRKCVMRTGGIPLLDEFREGMTAWQVKYTFGRGGGGGFPVSHCLLYIVTYFLHSHSHFTTLRRLLPLIARQYRYEPKSLQTVGRPTVLQIQMHSDPFWSSVVAYVLSGVYNWTKNQQGFSFFAVAVEWMKTELSPDGLAYCLKSWHLGIACQLSGINDANDV
jgi:hypothetical protein